MAKLSRTKGHTFEREMCTKIGLALSTRIQRNITQVRDSGVDCNPEQSYPLVIEAKRRKSLKTIMGWLQQAVRAIDKMPDAVAAPLVPIVVAREDNGKPIVILHLDDFLALAGSELLIRRNLQAPKGGV